MLSLHLHIFCVVPIKKGITRVGEYCDILYYYFVRLPPIHVYIIIITIIIRHGKPYKK